MVAVLLELFVEPIVVIRGNQEVVDAADQGDVEAFNVFEIILRRIILPVHFLIPLHALVIKFLELAVAEELQ